MQRNRQAKAIQQLRPQFAFFGVHGANEHKTRGVPVRDAVALHHIDAAGGYIQQGIDQGIGQQIDFVHIQDAAMRARHQAGQEAHLPVAQHVFHIQGAYQLFDAGRQRQADERRARQQGGQRARSSGFGRAARAADEHAAHARIYRRQQQRLPQIGVAQQGRERKALLARGLRRRYIHRRMARIRLQVKGQGLF